MWHKFKRFEENFDDTITRGTQCECSEAWVDLEYELIGSPQAGIEQTWADLVRQTAWPLSGRSLTLSQCGVAFGCFGVPGLSSCWILEKNGGLEARLPRQAPSNKKDSHSTSTTHTQVTA